MEQNTYKNNIMEYTYKQGILTHLAEIHDEEILQKIYTVTKTYYENCCKGKTE